MAQKLEDTPFAIVVKGGEFFFPSMTKEQIVDQVVIDVKHCRHDEKVGMMKKYKNLPLI